MLHCANCPSTSAKIISKTGKNKGLAMDPWFKVVRINMDRYGLRKKKKVFYIVVVSSSSCRDGLGRGRHGAMSGRYDLGRHLVGSGSMSERPLKVHDVGPWLLPNKYYRMSWFSNKFNVDAIYCKTPNFFLWSSFFSRFCYHTDSLSARAAARVLGVSGLINSLP